MSAKHPVLGTGKLWVFGQCPASLNLSLTASEPEQLLDPSLGRHCQCNNILPADVFTRCKLIASHQDTPEYTEPQSFPAGITASHSISLLALTALAG